MGVIAIVVFEKVLFQCSEYGACTDIVNIYTSNSIKDAKEYADKYIGSTKLKKYKLTIEIWEDGHNVGNIVLYDNL